MTFPAIGKLALVAGFDRCAAECVGLDGRAIRKMVANALGSSPQTAMQPERVTIENLLAAAKAARAFADLNESLAIHKRARVWFRILAGRRPAGMSKALSIDLRIRVLAAVADGLTHRAAGERFGVGAASVSRWRKLEREQGDAKPKALGGDRRSGRIEAQSATILALLGEAPDITLDELRCQLAGKGLIFDDGTIRRFLKRHKITRKKRPLMPPNRIAPTS